MSAEASPANDLANELSAGMAGVSPDEYVREGDAALADLDRVETLVDAATIATPDDYRKWMPMKSALSGLSCYAFNNKKPEFDRVRDLESRMGGKLATFARTHGRAKGLAASCIRYLFWRRYYPTVDLAELLADLARDGFLRKGRHGSYLVLGLHLAVGDNCFGVGDRNRQWRLRRPTCAIQALHLPSRACETLQRMEQDGAVSVPALDETLYTATSVGDHKHAVVVTCSRNDRQAVHDRYSSLGKGSRYAGTSVTR